MQVIQLTTAFQVCSVIAEILPCPWRNVTPDALLPAGLVHLRELRHALEGEFVIEFSPNVEDRWVYVRDVIEDVEREEAAAERLWGSAA